MVVSDNLKSGVPSRQSRRCPRAFVIEPHASAEHIDKAVHDPRRITPIREHPGQLVGQTETPLGHRQKHHAPIRGQAPTVEGSCDFLGVNGWK